MGKAVSSADEREVKPGDDEEQLRRLAAIVLDSNDAIILLDMDGNILAWNRGAGEMYGYTEDETLKMNIISIVPESERIENQDMMDRLRRGEAVRSFQTKRVTKDGRVLDVWLTVTVLKDEAGRPYNISTTERDITERKRAEERLRASNEELRVSDEELKSNIEELNSSQEQLREKVEELKATEASLLRLATVVRDSNDAVILVDFEGDIHAWNKGAEKIYGYSEAEIVGRNVCMLLPGDEKAPFMSILKKLLEGERITSYETRRVTRDGRTLDVWLTLTALADESGRPYMVATTERDITDIRRNAEELKDTVERLQFQTEQLETAKEELEVINEELFSTNSELDMVIKANEEKKRQLDYFNIAFLNMLRESMDNLNAKIRAAVDELGGEVSPERREVLEMLLDDDRRSVSTMHDFSTLLQVLSAKVHVEHVDLSLLVSSILDDLKRHDPGSTVKLFITKTLYAYVDRNLVGIALRYLLGDSWSHVREDANGKIYFMLISEASRLSFAIADNRRDYSIAESKLLQEPGEYRAETPPAREEDFRIAIAKLIIEKNSGEMRVEYKKGVYSVHFTFPILPV